MVETLPLVAAAEGPSAAGRPPVLCGGGRLDCNLVADHLGPSRRQDGDKVVVMMPSAELAGVKKVKDDAVCMAAGLAGWRG